MDFEGLGLTRVKVSLHESVLNITIVNPPANVLSEAVRNELYLVFLKAKIADEVREVVLRGEGKFFSGGADIKNELYPIVSSLNARERGYQFSRDGHHLVNFIRSFPKFITACIDGYALGGGMELTLACHRIIATRRSVFGLPEVTLGIIPGWGGTVFFQKKFKPDFIYTGLGYIVQGKLLTAKDAHGFGLVDELVDVGDDPVLPSLRVCSPTAQAYAKVIRMPFSDGYEDMLLDVEAFLFGKLCAHSDAREGLAAFLKRREPKFLQK